jgi:hypothetical protein
MPYIRNVILSLSKTILAPVLAYLGATTCFATPAPKIAPTPASLALCDQSREALVEASSIRGLPVISPVPCTVQDKPLVEAFLHETIKTELPPQKIQMEELAFRAVGLIPDDFNYGKQLVDFLVSQIGGYYDPKEKRFVMAAWLPSSIQHGVAVHELTHALQDQHFGLRKLLNPKAGTTDSDLAISALIEGDASAVMFDEQSRRASKIKLQEMPSVDSLLLFQVLGLNFGAEGGEVPDALKGILIFPYTSGLRFVHALLLKGGYAEIDKAYAAPPKTSREILHPDEFLAASFTPSIPEPSEFPGYSLENQPEYLDTLGEFAISGILSAAARAKPSAALAAKGWVGDRLGIFPLKNQARLISWITRWESERDAQEFLDTYTAFLESRYSTKLATDVTKLSESKSLTITRRVRDVTLTFTMRSSS